MTKSEPLDSPDNASRLCLICDRRFGRDQLNCPEDGSQLVFIKTSPNKIDKVAGYQIQGEVGAGISGKVYKAIEDISSQVVAIKILHESLIDNLEMVNRFKKEADLSSKVNLTKYSGCQTLRLTQRRPAFYGNGLYRRNLRRRDN